MRGSIVIPCSYCGTRVELAHPVLLDKHGETRGKCSSCGSTTGLQLRSFKRGDGQAKVRKALVGRDVQLLEERHSGLLGMVPAGTVCRVVRTEQGRLVLQVTLDDQTGTLKVRASQVQAVAS